MYSKSPDDLPTTCTREDQLRKKVIFFLNKKRVLIGIENYNFKIIASVGS